MDNRVIDIDSHKQTLDMKVQDLKSKCSFAGIGGKQYLNRLDKLLLDDMNILAKSIYENYFHRSINDGCAITTDNLVNEIKKTTKKMFDSYIKAIQHSSFGGLIRVDINDEVITSFKCRANKKLDSLCNGFSAECKKYLAQQKYNKKILYAAIAAVVLQILIFYLQYYTEINNIVLTLFKELISFLWGLWASLIF